MVKSKDELRIAQKIWHFIWKNGTKNSEKKNGIILRGITACPKFFYMEDEEFRRRFIDGKKDET